MTDTKMVKSAGEHWVCSVLARLGWGAALTRDGLERTDILAVQTTGSRRTVEIQVKAATDIGASTNFPLGAAAQKLSVSDREWFVLVVISPDITAAPRSYIVPRDHVAAATWIGHMDWLTQPGVPEGKRNTPVSNARENFSTWEGYRDRWDLLAHPNSAAPVLLPAAYRLLALSDRVGLPPGHPWRGAVPSW